MAEEEIEILGNEPEPDHHSLLQDDISDSIELYLPEVAKALVDVFDPATISSPGWLLTFDVTDDKGASTTAFVSSKGLSASGRLGLAYSALKL